MPQRAISTMKLEPERDADFTAEAAGNYVEYLLRKVEAGRASRHAGHGRTNDEVEATFAARRSQRLPVAE